MRDTRILRDAVTSEKDGFGRLSDEGELSAQVRILKAKLFLLDTAICALERIEEHSK